ncbi:UNVERIFIED_CONTAM: putative mitochondrial protein [Sesamum calycinum]|uniref:Mitochondrial protein n=1 Tax=Sesamum calycinum TaxID=2727403 RepID=A0AAW2K391_9LAMI
METVAGQPLGYLSSWPLFALTHHILMAVCRTGEKFTKYAVLGDDVVIADQEVARVQLMLDILYDALAHYVVLEVPDTGFFLGLTFALHLVLRNEMKPRDLRLTPDEFFVTEKVQDCLEWSLLRLWVRDWLKYCHWESTSRYLYLNPSGRKLGGVSGNSFLVQPFGLNQPSKRKNRGEAVELASIEISSPSSLRHSKHIGKFPVEREGLAQRLSRACWSKLIKGKESAADEDVNRSLEAAPRAKGMRIQPSCSGISFV